MSEYDNDFDTFVAPQSKLCHYGLKCTNKTTTCKFRHPCSDGLSCKAIFGNINAKGEYYQCQDAHFAASAMDAYVSKCPRGFTCRKLWGAYGCQSNHSIIEQKAAETVRKLANGNVPTKEMLDDALRNIAIEYRKILAEYRLKSNCTFRITSTSPITAIYL